MYAFASKKGYTGKIPKIESKDSMILAPKV